ncbi:MAG: hypothetical protein WAM28_00285 [Chlamydiales bacterium]
MLQLKEHIYRVPHFQYPVHSRVHPLCGFPPKCYVKRDDELGFGISGSKLRKYRTLLPYLKAQKIEEVIVVGGAFSNNVLGISQLLIENRMRPLLFLRGRDEKKGNALFTRLLVPQENIQWFTADKWRHIEKLAQERALKQTHLGIRTTWLPEGASCKQALPGALTLSLDICDNEKEMSLSFDHIFLEAGTAMTAAALILGLEWIEHPAHVHVLILAGSISEFNSQLIRCQKEMISFTGKKVELTNRFTLHQPETAKSFGSTIEPPSPKGEGFLIPRSQQPGQLHRL